MPYIYLLQRKVHFGTSIYKIGKTKDINQRLKAADYRQCKVICVVWVNNCDIAEKELITTFNKEFKQCISIDPNYQGDEDYEIDNLNKAFHIIFELTKNIELNEIQEIKTIESNEINISEWWNELDLSYNSNEFKSYTSTNKLFDIWIKFINCWPFYYNKENQLDLQKYFEPIRLEKDGEVYFKLSRYNGTKKHYLFDALVNRNKLKSKGLSDAGRYYIDFITNISCLINRSGNKLKYYDLNNNEHIVITQEYIIDKTTLKLFTKQVLIQDDKNKIYAKYGIQNTEFINEIIKNKKIMIPILNVVFIKYIKIIDYPSGREIIKFINDNFNIFDINLVIPWLIHNNVILVDTISYEKDDHFLGIDFNDNILFYIRDFCDCNNDLYQRIIDIINKIRPSMLYKD